MDTIPPSLYRIQHNNSYTIFEPTHGFESRGHYLMGYSFWLNKGRLESHLTWSARPDEPSPFISAFDNRGRLCAQVMQVLLNLLSDSFSSLKLKQKPAPSIMSVATPVSFQPKLILHRYSLRFWISSSPIESFNLPGVTWNLRLYPQGRLESTQESKSVLAKDLSGSHLVTFLII